MHAFADPPRVWVISAYRAGEQSQLLALAEALGWPFELKPVRHRLLGAPLDLLRCTGLFGIDAESAARFVPPWPDLLIAAGMRNEAIGRWVRQASGGRCRIVHVGRPWADPRTFDLVVATPQYRLPGHPQVLQNALTLHRVTGERLAEAADAHAERIARLPGPRIAVIVGGSSGPYAFGVRAARRLARQASELAASLGGSLLVSTSSRTPAVVTRTLADSISVPHELYRWRAGDPQNPYYAYLAAAERIVVSFDSIAMISEAAATGKALYLFDLSRDHGGDAQDEGQDWTPTTLGYRLLMRFGPDRLGRDISLVHERLLAEGRAAWLGQAHPHPEAELPASRDVERAVERVRDLFRPR